LRGRCPWRGRGPWRLALAAGLLAGSAGAQPANLIREETGYRVEPGAIVVEDPAHWRGWDAGDGTRLVAEDGTVRPRYVRLDIDATTDAAEFMNVVSGDTTFGGVSAWGNAADSLTAPFVMDGDLATWWEPDTESVDDAWVEMDLGRTVIARRIRVRFADTGDPFLMFRVLVSDGTETFGRNRTRQFLRAGQVASPNKDQREFVFDLAPRRPVPDGVEGEPVQFVRIDLLGTDGPRAEEVSQADYFALPAEDRGAVDYFRVTVIGREIPVERDSYLQLDADERGPIRYHRRERPRLAEVEVEAMGDNVVALTQRLLRESGNFFDDLVLRFVTDGLVRSGITMRQYNPFSDRDQLVVDLGARFWLERIRLISDQNPLTSYQMRLSDGSLNAEGNFVWTTFDERLNAQRYLEVEETFPTRPVRLIELRRLNLLSDERLSGKLNELQAYGEGYVSEVTMTSPLIKFDGREMIDRVDWEAEAPLGTTVEIRTRSGDELIQIPRYFNYAGGEISEALWERLPEDQQGPVRVDEFPGADWSPWSEAYLQPGAFQSPSPRLMALVQVRLRTVQPLRAASIRRLSLALAPPLVDVALAEVTPIRRVEPGQQRDFSIYLRIDEQPDDPGYEQINLRSGAAAAIEVTRIEAGTDESLRFGAGDRLWPGDAEVLPLADGVGLRLPDGTLGDGRVLRIDFRASVFLPSTTFQLDLVSPGGERTQRVDAGDASSLIPSNQLVVVSELQGLPLLAPLALSTPVVTPNGDGVNDEVELTITIFQIEGPRRLGVAVHDLSGRRVRDLGFSPAAPSGEHRVIWDGRDDRGERVTPGIYVVRVDVPTDADADGTAAARSVTVVY
jgi:hypothetical protein